MTFQEKIVLLRKVNRISQSALGKEIGVSRQSIYKWEEGLAYPEIKHVIHMKKLFSVSLDELLDDEVSLPEEILLQASSMKKSKNKHKASVVDNLESVEAQPKEIENLDKDSSCDIVLEEPKEMEQEEPKEEYSGTKPVENQENILENPVNQDTVLAENGEDEFIERCQDEDLVQDTHHEELKNEEETVVDFPKAQSDEKPKSEPKKSPAIFQRTSIFFHRDARKSAMDEINSRKKTNILTEDDE